MTQFICDHPDFVGYFIGLLIAILGGACSLIIYFLKVKVRRLQSIEGKLDSAIQNHDFCRETLPDRFASKTDVEHICAKIDNLSEKLSQFSFIYRTKDEASREWRL